MLPVGPNKDLDFGPSAAPPVSAPGAGDDYLVWVGRHCAAWPQKPGREAVEFGRQAYAAGAAAERARGEDVEAVAREMIEAGPDLNGLSRLEVLALWLDALDDRAIELGRYTVSREAQTDIRAWVLRLRAALERA